jgi:hypothetical protein
MPVAGNNGDSRTTCLTATPWQTTRLTNYPQPTAGEDRKRVEGWAQFSANASDPGGLSFVPMYDFFNAWAFNLLSDQFPNLPAATSCSLGEPGPNWAGFTQTSWMDPVRTTMYIGEENQASKPSATSTSTQTPATPAPTPNGGANPTPAAPASTKQGASSVAQSSSSPPGEVQYSTITVSGTPMQVPAVAVPTATTGGDRDISQGGEGGGDGGGTGTGNPAATGSTKTSMGSQSMGRVMDVGWFLSFGAWAGIWLWLGC